MNQNGGRQGFRIGARGFLVEEIQNRLGLKADGIFGKWTEAKVREFQRGAGVEEDGVFSDREYALAGMKCPDEFMRCAQLVSVLEGTGFGDCNRTDIDGAGITLGIAGFTSAHGEVQELLARFFSQNPAELSALPRLKQKSLSAMLTNPAPPAAWAQWFYDSKGRAEEALAGAVRKWGTHEDFRALQLAMAREKFWVPALKTAERLGFSGSRARLFYYDTAVQNGGWRKSHEVMAGRMPLWIGGNEEQRLAAASIAVSSLAKEKWRHDVLARKSMIAQGAGTVHGTFFRLRDYWLG